jgi:hypothetical protein
MNLQTWHNIKATLGSRHRILQRNCGKFVRINGYKKSKTTPYHPQCNSQVEVVNIIVAKYLGDFVSSNTLDWEALIPAMSFAYDTTMNRTTMNTPFFHRTPYFSLTADYSENFLSDLSGRMKIKREVANKHMKENSQS